jgi:hypothetical protein
MEKEDCILVSHHDALSDVVSASQSIGHSIGVKIHRSLHAHRNISSLFCLLWIVCIAFCMSHLFFHQNAYPSIDPTSLRYLSVLHPETISSVVVTSASSASFTQSSSMTDLSSNVASNELATLQCQDSYGGPSDEYAQEMVYWHDIPSDAQYISPLRRKVLQSSSRRQRKYMVRTLLGDERTLGIVKQFEDWLMNIRSSVLTN